MRKLRSVIFGLGAVLTVPAASAAGFQLGEFSAAAQGRANAGETAMTDTAASLARNSAVMGNFEGSSISIVYHYINPEVDVKGKLNNGTDASKKDIAPTAHIPGFYYIQGIDDKWAVGLSLNSHFGLATDYGNSYGGSEFANETSIKTYYLTPHVSFKPIESLTLGLGLSYIHGEGKIKNTAPNNFQAPIEVGGNIVQVPISQGSTIVDVEGDGDAFGYTVGLLWNADENTRVGFSYRSRVDLKLKGDVTKLGTAKQKGELTLNLPEVYELGVAHDLNDTFTLMGGLQKTGWHRFKELKGKSHGQVVFQKDENWRDAYRISAGAEWHVIEMLTLRGGIAYDESPVENDDRSLSIPDAARKWFTLGATLDLGKGGSIDAAFAYLKGSKVSVNETSLAEFDPSGLHPSSTADYNFKGGLSKTDAFIYSIGYNISF